MILDELIAEHQARIELLRIAQARMNDDAAEIADLRGQIVGLREKLAAVPVPLPNPPSLWRWDARTVAPFGIQAKENSRVSLVQAGGRNAVRLLTLPGDADVAGSGSWERTDLSLGRAESDSKEGREWWIKHCIWFPSDYVDLPQSDERIPPGKWNAGSVFNWHDDSNTPGSQGPLQLQVFPPTATSPDRPTGMHFEVYGGVGGLKFGAFPVAPIERNKWYDFMYHIRWTSTSTGFADGWVNGRQFMAHKGPTLHAGHGAYLKLANYHSPHGKPSSVYHGPIVMAETEAGLR